VEELNITQSLTLCFMKLKQRKLKITVRFLSQIPVPTVKWVANRNKPIKNSSGILTISEDGNLVVLDGQKKILWSSSLTNSVVNSSAQLLDSGNLILQGNTTGTIIWESFQHPSEN